MAYINIRGGGPWPPPGRPGRQPPPVTTTPPAPAPPPPMAAPPSAPPMRERPQVPGGVGLPSPGTGFQVPRPPTAPVPLNPSRPPAGPSQVAPGSLGGIFSDQATAAFEKLLNQRIGQLNTPYANPDFQPAIDQLHQYLAQLNGPAYTSQQQDIMQTQALDPMERQRMATKQQALERLASRNIGPGSGIFESVMEGIDQQYNTIRAQTQSGFATRGIEAEKQQASQAASLAPMIAQLQRGQFDSEEARRQMAVQLAEILPTMAWNRLLGAQGSLTPLTPGPWMNQQQGGSDTAALFQLLSGLLNRR